MEAVFITQDNPPGVSILSYTDDVTPADLFDYAAGDTAPPSPLPDWAAADKAIAAAGYVRTSVWCWADDIWGALVERSSNHGV